MNYPMRDCEKGISTEVSLTQTIRQRLEEQRRALKDHLDALEKALEFMDKNPTFESFHDILRKCGY